MNHAKKTLLYFILHTSIGVMALLALVTGVFPEGYQRSLLYGIVGGFLVSGILGILICIGLLRNPQKAMDAEIMKTEERTQYIRMRSNSTTYTVLTVAESIGTLATGLLGYKEASITIAIILIFQIIIFIGVSNFYSRKY